MRAADRAAGPRILDVPLRNWIAVGGAVIGAFMAVLDIQITNASLRYIQGGVAASLDQGTWISTGYLVAEIIAIPMAGWLGGVLSLRRFLLIAASSFLVFSLLCGTATSLAQIVLYRIGQGLTGGALIPTAMTIILTKLPKERQPIGLALFAVTATFGPAIGPLIGGWLTDTYDWRWIFYINILPGCLLIATIWYGLDPEPIRLDRLRHGDWAGMVAMALGFGSLECVLEEGQRNDWFGSPMIAWLSVLAGTGIAAGVAIELTVREPFFNIRLLRDRSLAASCVGALALGFGLFGTIYILPVYLGGVQGYDALQIGEAVMWMGLPQLAITPLMPLLMKRIDPRLLCGLGMALFAASNFMNTDMTHDTAAIQLRAAMLVRALGQPMVITPLTMMATATIAPGDAAGASGLFNVARNLGGSIGIALLQTFVEIREHFHFDAIAQHVTPARPMVQAALRSLALIAPGHSQARAVAQLAEQVRREATVLAYSDCFWIMGAGMLLAVVTVVFMRKPG